MKKLVLNSQSTDIEKEIRKAQRKAKVRKVINDTKQWINDNRDLLIVLVPAGVAIFKGSVKLGRSISRNIALKQEKDIKELKIYDRSLGRYVDLKRPLNQSDMKIILERKDNGEKLSNILMDMDLMK